MTDKTCKTCRWWSQKMTIYTLAKNWGNCVNLKMADDLECNALQVFHDTNIDFGCIHHEPWEQDDDCDE